MLCVQSRKGLLAYCGTTMMHPAATRAIRIPTLDADPTEIATEILSQYAELIEQRRQKVKEDAPHCEPDMRVGWLLWQESLEEFLYFEQEMLAPDPADYWAEWKESGGGMRKASRTIWVYERESDRKRYSITTSAGAKIQPYFDVPAPNDPHLYHFRVQGEQLDGGLVRIWITTTTALLLRQVMGNLDPEALSAAIISVAERSATAETRGSPISALELAQPVMLTLEAYRVLITVFAGVSDEHRIQLFLHSILR